MLSFRSISRPSAKLGSGVALFSLLLAQGVQAAPTRLPPENAARPGTAPARQTTQVEFLGEGYTGPVYWDTFPQVFEIITTHNGQQQVIPGPDSQVRLLVQLKGEPLAVYQQGLARMDAAAHRAALEAYQAELQAARRQLLADLETLGISVAVNDEFSYLFNGMALSAPEEARLQIAALPQVAGVFPDYQVKATLNDSVPLIGAPDIWAMTDPDGNPVVGGGMRVAVIDTGIDYTHPGLGGCFGAGCKVAGGYDFANDDADPADDHGHGTHVAGIVAADGPLLGVAPGASLLAYKVLDMYGSGWDSDIIAAIEAAANPDGNLATDDAVDVINMSLGGPGNPDDPFSQAVDHAADLGIVTVVAAGNDSDYFTLGAPASARKAITVGASDKSDWMAAFSSRGPVGGYFDMVKPDVTAPGVAISSTVPITGLLGSDTRYTLLSGTSMASPHVAGAAALLRQMHPDWPPQAIKASLMNTAQDIGADVFSQGAGRIQGNLALTTTSLVLPGAVAFGMVAIEQDVWHAQRVVTVTNTALETLVYTLTATLPLTPTQGITLTVSPANFSLAPAASQQITLTLAVDNGRVPFGPSPSMAYEASLMLDAGGRQSIRVPYAFTKAASLVVTLGENQSPFLLFVHDRQEKAWTVWGFPTITETVFYLPQGSYDVVTEFLLDDTLVIRENVEVEAITHIAMRPSDARHQVTFEAFDVQGDALPLTYETTRGVFFSGWVYGSGAITSQTIRIYNEEDILPPTYHFSNLSADYSFKMRVPVKPPERPNDYYEVVFPIDDGLSGDAHLQNNPQDFRSQLLDFRPDVGGRPYTVGPVWVTAWPEILFGFSMSDWARSSPLTQTVHLPALTPAMTSTMTTVGERYFTAFAVSPADDWFDNLYQTAMLYAATDRDSVQFSTGFDALPDVAEGNLLLGGAPLYWSGQLELYGEYLIMNRQRPGLSDQGMGQAFTSPFTYTLFHAGTLVDEGVLSSGFAEWELSEQGAYTMEVRHSGYTLAGQAGLGLATSVFDTTRQDAVPPYLVTLNVLESGWMTDIVSTGGVVRFSLGDNAALADVALALRLDDGAWVDMPLSRDGDFYVAGLSSLKPASASMVSLRIDAQDAAGNIFSYEASPAFIPMAHESTIYLPLITR